MYSAESECLIVGGNKRESSPSNLVAIKQQKRYRIFTIFLVFCILSYLLTNITLNKGNEKSAFISYSDKNEIESLESEDKIKEIINELSLIEKKDNEQAIVKSTTKVNSIKAISTLSTYQASQKDFDLIPNYPKERISTVKPKRKQDERTSTKMPNPSTQKPTIKNTLLPSTPIKIKSTTIKPKIAPIKNKTANSILRKEEFYSNSGCKIPKLNPFDPLIKRFIKKDYAEPNCSLEYPLLFKLGLDSTLVPLNASSPSWEEWKSCCYKIISRSRDLNLNKIDSKETLSEKCFPLNKTKTDIPPEHEFIAVFCTNVKNSSKPQLVDAFGFTPLKPEVEERINKLQKTSKIRADERLNVVILGLDAVSHMEFKRIMPKVEQYLVQNLSAIGMNGYVKIGDNTLPNLLSLLTSWDIKEVSARCEKSRFYDACPFIWKNFSSAGYRTSFAEDETWMGIFNYLKNGFKSPPVDYYARPWLNFADANLSSDHRGNTELCYGPRINFKLILNYLQKLAQRMGSDKRYFQLSWATSLTHDYLNQGHIGEDPLLETLKWFKSEDYLNKTVFILMSDHGQRFGSFRTTYQGKIEENMPFIYFVFPEWFKAKYSLGVGNMISNSNKLTSPFDIHETLMDILNARGNLEKGELRRREKLLKKEVYQDKMKRGMSLFLPVPEIRTCAMAGISEHWCICNNSMHSNLNLKSKLVEQAANYAVFGLNSLFSNYSDECAYLSLSKVNRAQSKASPDKHHKDKVVEISFVTSPGGGEFDGTVIKKRKGGWALSGGLSRINLYGNQSHCVNDKEMKKYCYCLDNNLYSSSTTQKIIKT